MHEALIRKYFDDASLSYDDGHIRRFNQLLKLLLQYNASHDLTRITNMHEIIIKHIVDSLIISQFIAIPSPLLDIGTGAGFPGIPLAIVHDQNRFILAESRHKRIEFIQIVKKELQLDNIDVYPHLVTEKSFFDVKGVITRAVEKIPETLERCSHFLKIEDSVIFMKGPAVDNELGYSNDDYSLFLDKQYTLPATSYHRRLIVYKKTTDTIRKMYYIPKEGASADGIAVISSENKRFKELRKIAGNPKKYNSTLVVGKKIIKELYKTKNELCKYFILYDGYTESDSEFIDVLSRTTENNILILKKSLFNEIDAADAHQPMMVAELPPINQWEYNCQELSLMIPFQDPVNVGAAIRSAAAFGVDHIIMCRNAASPYHPKAVRASAGAVFNCTIEKGPAIDEIEFDKLPCPLIALDLHGQDINTFAFPQKGILLAGIEGQGLPSAVTFTRVRIPMLTIESLNAAVALSIALYEWQRHKIT